MRHLRAIVPVIGFCATSWIHANANKQEGRGLPYLVLSAPYGPYVYDMEEPVASRLAQLLERQCIAFSVVFENISRREQKLTTRLSEDKSKLVTNAGEAIIGATIDETDIDDYVNNIQTTDPLLTTSDGLLYYPWGEKLLMKGTDKLAKYSTELALWATAWTHTNWHMYSGLYKAAGEATSLGMSSFLLNVPQIRKISKLCKLVPYPMDACESLGDWSREPREESHTLNMVNMEVLGTSLLHTASAYVHWHVLQDFERQTARECAKYMEEMRLKCGIEFKEYINDVSDLRTVWGKHLRKPIGEGEVTVGAYSDGCVPHTLATYVAEWFQFKRALYYLTQLYTRTDIRLEQSSTTKMDVCKIARRLMTPYLNDTNTEMDVRKTVRSIMTPRMNDTNTIKRRSRKQIGFADDLSSAE